MTTKKKNTKKGAPRPRPARDNVLAAVEFVLGDDGYVRVQSRASDSCPPETKHAADVAAHLLFEECRRNGAVAVRLGDRVVLAQPA